MKKLLVLVLTLLHTTSYACEYEQANQFDFWLGDWQVTTPDGEVTGRNQIHKILNNCAIQEHYTTLSGYEGFSYNTYDTSNKQWHQTWVDNSGVLLKLDGGLKHGSMVLEGQRKNEKGITIHHRISWTPNENGDVRQHWQSSDDKGKTWTTLFDGLYQKH